MICALVLLISGLGIAFEGHCFGWLLVALGAINTALGFFNLRKTERTLRGEGRFNHHE